MLSNQDIATVFADPAAIFPDLPFLSFPGLVLKSSDVAFFFEKNI